MWFYFRYVNVAAYTNTIGIGTIGTILNVLAGGAGIDPETFLGAAAFGFKAAGFDCYSADSLYRDLARSSWYHYAKGEWGLIAMDVLDDAANRKRQNPHP